VFPFGSPSPPHCFPWTGGLYAAKGTRLCSSLLLLTRGERGERRGEHFVQKHCPDTFKEKRSMGILTFFFLVLLVALALPHCLRPCNKHTRGHCMVRCQETHCCLSLFLFSAKVFCFFIPGERVPALNVPARGNGPGCLLAIRFGRSFCARPLGL
jgi:hypothetical protein